MITLNSIFTSNMIMQANMPVRFFGSGAGTVAITFNGNEKRFTNEKDSWLIEFEAVPYGGPYDIKVELDGIFITLHNIYFGDVYLLGGQSNMQFKLHESSELQENYRGNSNVRLYTVDRMEVGEYFCSRDGWVELSSDTAPNFSAIGYYIGQGLASNDRKIGLIACYQGASVIQSWLPKEIALLPKFKLENKFIDHEWFPSWNGDGVLFDNMLLKILPFSLNGVIWYQGESNASVNEANIYAEFLKELVSSWRDYFKNEDLKFVIIQLADHLDRAGYAWSKIQEEQLLAERIIPKVKTVICRDVCDNIDIHPKEKDVLSKRVVKALENF